MNGAKLNASIWCRTLERLSARTETGEVHINSSKLREEHIFFPLKAEGFKETPYFDRKTQQRISFTCSASILHVMKDSLALYLSLRALACVCVCVRE